MTYRVTRSGNVVDEEYCWRPIDDETPMNVKLQLLTKYGIAQHGMLTPSNRSFYTDWTPLPRKRNEHVDPSVSA